MTPTPADFFDQVEHLLRGMVGSTIPSAERTAVDFEAYASVAPTALRERLATVLVDEIRTASDQVEIRRAAMQRFRL